MRIMRLAALVLALGFMPGTSHAAHYSDLYVLPVAGQVNGFAGSMWASDIAINNFQSTPLTVSFVFIETGAGRVENGYPLILANGTPSVTVPANGNVFLREVLGNFRPGANVLGSVVVGADRPFAITSRSYSQDAARTRTAGQTVPGIADFLTNATGMTNNAMAVAYIPGLVHNSRFRTNLGFAAAASDSNDSMSVEYTLRGADGTILGSKLFFVPRGQFMHLQFPSVSVTPSTFDVASAQVRIVSGSGAVVPYASVIDNASSDASFVLGTFPPNSPRTMSATSAGTAASHDWFRLHYERIMSNR